MTLEKYIFTYHQLVPTMVVHVNVGFKNIKVEAGCQ